MNSLANLFQLFGGNPQQMLMQMLNNGAKNNPMLKNVLEMVQNNDSKGVESLARNLAKEKGINVDNYLSIVKGKI